MRAMLLDRPHAPLREATVPDPEPGRGQVLLRVAACGVCRTDLHVADGELTGPRLPLVLGHEIVGRVMAVGSGGSRFRVGDRVGVPWLGWTCGECAYCRSGRAVMLGFDQQIYGAETQLEFLRWIRPEQRFNSLDELAQKIAEDVQLAIDSKDF